MPQAPAAPEAAEIEYDITVRIDPAQRSIQGNSIITVKKGEELTLVLGRRFGVMSARIDGVALGPAPVPGICVPGAFPVASRRRAGSKSNGAENFLRSTRPSITLRPWEGMSRQPAKWEPFFLIRADGIPT